MSNHASTPRRAELSVGKTAYVGIALRTATSKINALEKELHEMHSIIGDHERRRHEAEAKAFTAQRKAQDLEIRFNISDKRRKDAEDKTKELETQITEAISSVWKSNGIEILEEDISRFDKIKEVFDGQAFQESKKRANAEHKAHEMMKRRAEAEAKCLEETERRVQAEIRTKQEIRTRIDEEMRNKALRSKLKDAEEKIKVIEQLKQKKVEMEENFKTMLKQAHQSLTVAEQNKKEMEVKSVELENKIMKNEKKIIDCEKKMEDKKKTIGELQTCLEQAKVEFQRNLEYSSKQLEESSKKVEELQLVIENVAHAPLGRLASGPLDGPPDYGTSLCAIAAQELNYVKLGELQTLNADLEVTIRELKENINQHKHDDLKIFNLLNFNSQLEVKVDELKRRLEQEDHAKTQLHVKIEELEDTAREQTQKLHKLQDFQDSPECERISDSLIALRVEENPLFRPEPVSNNLQGNFSSRPESVTDDSQMSPTNRPQSIMCKSQQISYSSPAMASSDSEVMESPISNAHNGNDYLYHQKKQSLMEKLSQNEALIRDLSGRVQEGHTKQSELECELKKALHSREVAEMKANALMSQLELALQREKERDKDFLDLSGTSSFRGKKEKWGILCRFRSKIKAEV